MNEDQITLIEYIEAVQDTLQYWLDIHTNARAWAQGWNIDDDWQYTLKACPVIKNSYFEFNLLEACAYQLAKDTRGDYSRCNRCGAIYDRGYDCDNCQKECKGTPTIGELSEWLKELGAESFTDDQIERAMIEQGFKVYREALKDIIAPVVSEVKDVIKSIKRAKSNEDRLAAVLWGTRVYHVHGGIMSDYSDRSGSYIDSKLIDNIRNNGLNSVFSADEINAYLEG